MVMSVETPVRTVKLQRLILIALLMSGVSPSMVHAFPFSYLQLESTISADTLANGDSISLDITVKNEEKPPSYEPAVVATNTVVTIDFPPGATNLVSPDCVQADTDTLTCELPELSIGSVVNLVASATLNTEGYRELTMTLDADDLFAGAQVVKKRITVVAQPPDLSPIDLENKLTTTGNETEVSDFVYVTATVRNSHPANTVNFPAFELLVPESLTLVERDDGCDYAGNVATCELLALPPLAESKISFELIGKTIDPEVTIIGSVNSTQPDALLQNNESQLVTSVIPFEAEVLCGASNPLCFGSADNGDPGDTDNSNNELIADNAGNVSDEVVGSELEPASATDESADSGGGSMPVFLSLFLLLLAGLVRRKGWR